MTNLLSWQWVAREPALTPAAAVAWGETVVHRLHQRLLALPTEQHAQLMLTARSNVLLVSGPTPLLPWVAGIQYAAPLEYAPGLWLPTQWQPNVPGELLAQALQKQYQRSPLLLWPKPTAVLPLDRLQPLSTALLQQIAQGWAI